MENGEHLSIEMKKLGDSLIGKMESLHPLSKHCSIYRIPEPQRCLNPSHYTPQMVSIGPLHHGKPELKVMEEHKLRYLNYFLRRTQVSVPDFLTFIRKKEIELRNCYSEIIGLESDEFVTMVFVDSVFMIELFLRNHKPALMTDDDRMLGKPFLSLQIRSDFCLLENQLPLFILIDLFNLAKPVTDCALFREISFVKIASNWIQDDALELLPIGRTLLESNFSRAQHFLDLLILSLHPFQLHSDRIVLQDPNIPSANELHQAGVKFKPGSSNNLMDIKFNNGTLEIQFFKVYEKTELLLRNLLAFECMQGYRGHLNDYVVMMHQLISDPKDAELLIQNGIVGIGDSEVIPTIFQNLDKETTFDYRNFQYSVVVANLQEHCKVPRNKWKANLKQNYFNTPWASISVIAAVILLLLTITQTVCSFLAL